MIFDDAKDTWLTIFKIDGTEINGLSLDVLPIPDEFGITDAITDGAEREDSEIEFTQLDQNGPALIKPSTSELIKRWS